MPDLCISHRFPCCVCAAGLSCHGGAASNSQEGTAWLALGDLVRKASGCEPAPRALVCVAHPVETTLLLLHCSFHRRSPAKQNLGNTRTTAAREEWCRSHRRTAGTRMARHVLRGREVRRGEVCAVRSGSAAKLCVVSWQQGSARKGIKKFDVWWAFMAKK